MELKSAREESRPATLWGDGNSNLGKRIGILLGEERIQILEGRIQIPEKSLEANLGGKKESGFLRKSLKENPELRNENLTPWQQFANPPMHI